MEIRTEVANSILPSVHPLPHTPPTTSPSLTVLVTFSNGDERLYALLVLYVQPHYKASAIFSFICLVSANTFWGKKKILVETFRSWNIISPPAADNSKIIVKIIYNSRLLRFKSHSNIINYYNIAIWDCLLLAQLTKLPVPWCPKSHSLLHIEIEYL